MSISNDDYLCVYQTLETYLTIIIEEYGKYLPPMVMKNLSLHKKELIQWNDKRTCSFFVENGILKLPYSIYDTFSQLLRQPNYGIRKRSYKPTTYLDTNTTYMQYIDEVIECGLGPTDYFLESLLHETMHVCGSTGALPLAEGVNELKTRELAQKHHLNIAGMGYPKEVEIALLFQQIVGQNVMNQLTFVPLSNKRTFLSTTLGGKYGDLYNTLEQLMTTQMKKASAMFTTPDPFKKAQLYDQIHYEKALTLIKTYKRGA